MLDVIERDSVRVSADKWRDYRKNHEFLNPSCLCALFQPQGEVLCYTKAAIYLPLNGRYRYESGSHADLMNHDEAFWLGRATFWLERPTQKDEFIPKRYLKMKLGLLVLLQHVWEFVDNTDPIILTAITLWD